jgi:multidrug resistance efflux pump
LNNDKNYKPSGTLNNVLQPKLARKLSVWVLALFVLLFVILFLPWTQNVEANGKLTTLTPDSRPQEIHSTIAGRIEKWYVKEGDAVKRGDTILHLSEIKVDYFDPQLLERTEWQLKAKESSIISYASKIQSLNAQIQALKSNIPLKMSQTRNKLDQTRLKVRTDSMLVVAADTALSVAKKQLDRTRSLFEDNIKSKNDLEDKLNKYQESVAKYDKTKNDFLISRNDFINTSIELNSLMNDFTEKISKAESDRASAESMLFTAEAEKAKMMNQLSNYQIRSGFYYITAPQNGYIFKTLSAGIGETVKENDAIATIVPQDPDLAVELYIEPVDVPLMRLNKRVRINFDGWPAFVFSGWPGASFGTFGGIVAAIDNGISENGKYRIFVKPDPDDMPWPEQLRVGQGARGILLLSDVPIWRELWRQLNGFPAEFYQPEDKNASKNEKKK